VKTNAHKRYYQTNQQIDGGKLPKYKNIIAPLVLTTREQEEEKQSTSGQGLLKEVNKNAIDLIYWDDPNELVGRLHLLISSQAAGNFNHRNEIISIIEELREANIIELKSEKWRITVLSIYYVTKKGKHSLIDLDFLLSSYDVRCP
jgi:hypothetical protein